MPYSLLGGGVYVGNPAKKIYSYEEWIEKEKQNIKNTIVYDGKYKIGNISEENKQKMKEELSIRCGYIE